MTLYEKDRDITIVTELEGVVKYIEQDGVHALIGIRARIKKIKDKYNDPTKSKEVY